MLRLLPTNQIWRYWSLETFLDDAAGEGVRGVDLWLCSQHVCIDAYGVHNADALVNACKGRGVDVRTLTPEQSNPKAYNIASCDPLIIRLTRGYYEHVVKLAELLGARRISLNAGWFPYDVERGRAWDCMVRALGAVCSAAAGRGIDVCLETLARTPCRLVCGIDDLARALDDVGCPNLKATLDTGTIARGGECVSGYLERLGQRVGYVHLTNLDRRVMSHVAWGDASGELNPALIVSELESGGYEGDCALEMTHPSYFGCPREVLSRTKTVLKGCGL